MKNTIVCLLALSAALPLGFAQTQDDVTYWQRARSLLERSQRGEVLSPADESFLTEARQRRAQEQPGRSAGMQGDGAIAPEQWPVPGIQVSLETSPVMPLEIRAADGRKSTIFWRKPSGTGPCPAIIFIHGGLDEFPASSLRAHLTGNPVITRFLAADYAVVMATFRSYSNEIQSRGPILDGAAALEATAKLTGVDPKRLFVYGGSGGGSIAFELASHPALRAVVACEPATVIFSGMLTTGDYGPRLEMMREPGRFFTPEIREQTLSKLRKIRCPVLIIHGDQHDLIKLNKPILLPLMREAGVAVEYREYAGYGHGFYWGAGADKWGKGADLKVVEAVVAETMSFLGAAP